jgi:arginyl-tRNA synthetase
MNLISRLKDLVINQTQLLFNVTNEQLARIEFKINVEDEKSFGDVSCNVAMILAKQIGKSPREIATALEQVLLQPAHRDIIAAVTIAGPGFLNLTLTSYAWKMLLQELFAQKRNFFKLAPQDQKQKYLIEFVSANPTGPLHLGHGRGGIIGDTLARVLGFLGHSVSKEFYINDAGSQIKKLGLTLKARCLQQMGIAAELPEDGYAGEYMVDLAKDCIAEHGDTVKEKSDQFFELYAKEHMLKLLKATLTSYNITFDCWYSEKSLHDSGAIERTLNELKAKDLVYELDGALWFKSTAFGDDKDRVVKKSNGELTYVAADIAYHKDKFDRGYDVLIDILGHDHHGYVKRLKATMEALGQNPDMLQVVLYQLVNIKDGGVAVRMSKRAGTFTKLSDVIEEVGTDVARFFYLNRKTDMPLDFDLATALKKTDENPVYYIQYAYVRINSLMHKAAQEGFGDWVSQLRDGKVSAAWFDQVAPLIGPEEAVLIKKITAMNDILRSIAGTHQTHTLSYYAWELAQKMHTYYTKHKVLDASQQELSRFRLFMVFTVHQTLDLSLDLLGLSKPEKM